MYTNLFRTGKNCCDVYFILLCLLIIFLFLYFSRIRSLILFLSVFLIFYVRYRYSRFFYVSD